MKIYTVKSNARRDARKAGRDPALVVAVPGGFAIGPISKPAEMKRAILLARLHAGWISLPALMTELDWQAHTVRGAISTIAKADSLDIERRRENGLTSYRAVAS